MYTTEIRPIGNSQGAIFPQEMLNDMKLKKGDKINAKKVAGGYFISAYDEEVSEQLIAAEKIMHKYREAFRELSKKMSIEPIWLAPEVVMTIHDHQISEHGGLEGVRDENLLISAIMRPQNMLAYEQPTIFEMAASLGFGLAKNHPFNDANKRTATACCLTFLYINSFLLEVTQKDLVETVLQLASDKISQQEFAKWLELNCKKV